MICYNFLMKRQIWGYLSLLFSLILLVLGFVFAPFGEKTHAQDGVKYFPRTGHTITGAFLAFWEQSPNPEALLGLPITEAFYRPSRGDRIQYFQRAVVFIPPHSQQPYLLPLGEMFYRETASQNKREPLFSNVWDLAGCGNFPGTDEQEHPVCFEFREFYNTYKDYLGKVVSDPLAENGVPVQYVQAGRLENTPNGVRLAPLGEWYFQKHEPNKAAAQPIDGRAAIQRAAEILDLKVRVFSQSLILRPRARQHFAVVVTDQLDRPVPNAIVQITFYDLSTGKVLPSTRAAGTPYTFRTDENGWARFELLVPEHVGFIVAEVQATYQQMHGKGSTTFCVWW